LFYIRLDSDIFMTRVVVPAIQSTIRERTF
jgi:hypothetical protein